MNKEIIDIQREVINDLSELIRSSKTAYESEARYPNPDADRMDDRLKIFHKRVIELRRVRQELEDLFWEPTP